MSTTEKFAYPKDFSQEYPQISVSQWNALHKTVDDGYLRSTGLSLSDPIEIWQFIIGQTEPLASNAVYARFRESVGRPTLHQTVLRLAEQIPDDALLAKHLATLLKVHSHGPLKRVDYELGRRDNDRTTRVLVEHWVTPYWEEKWLPRSLCVFSGLAMAKMVFYLANKKPLPPALLSKEPERIRKLCDSLGLIRAERAVIKDFRWDGRTFELIPFKGTRIKGS